MSIQSQWKLAGKLYTLDKTPPTELLTARSDTVQSLLDENLTECMGYCDYLSYPSIPRVALPYQYWQQKLDPRMLGTGLFTVIWAGRLDLKEVLKARQTIQVYYVLTDRSYVLERLYRDLEHLELTQEELTELFQNDLLQHYESRLTAQETLKLEQWINSSPIELSTEQINAFKAKLKKSSSKENTKKDNGTAKDVKILEAVT